MRAVPGCKGDVVMPSSVLQQCGMFSMAALCHDPTRIEVFRKVMTHCCRPSAPSAGFCLLQISCTTIRAISRNVEQQLFSADALFCQEQALTV